MLADILTAGDSLDFSTSVTSYPATSGYTLKYRLVPFVSGPPITLTATANGADYRIQASVATTGGWVAGNYSWSAWVEKAGERHVVDTGLSQILADPSTITAFDGRSVAQKALQDCLAAFATFQSSGGLIKRYQIAGREMEFADSAVFIERISFWKGEVLRENAANAKSEGLPDPRRITLRMSNA